ncbi:MAG TPA: YegS/Rv2252/BmrU family lipid kinase [Blastocatellia bacterium]|nr:YegS/Rv2252/BmrU family lipid kinase [Blastocatellia bacterium]
MNHKRATIIYNPMSGRPGRRADDARRMIERLADRGVGAEAHATAGPDDATKLAAAALAAGANIIISYGGDGTLNEVIQGMAGSQTALAVWPGGTANVVARDLGVPFEIEELANMIAAGKTRRIALGLAKAASGFRVQGSEFGVQGSAIENGSLNREPGTLKPEPGTPGRYFVMMAGIGLDASIARSVSKKLKRRMGEFAYWLSGVKHLFLWRAEPFTIEVDGRAYKGAFALIGNGKGYGGGMMMTPGARLEEPWFQVYILPPLANNFAYLRALGACMRGKPEVAGVSLVRGKHIKANSAHEPWVEADGEIIGPLPMTFDIVPDALSVIVP